MTLAYLDGKFVDKSSITISPLDFGFSRGVGVYEFARLYQGKPFRLDDHSERLRHGADAFGIACPSAADIAGIVARLSAEHRYAHSTVKFYLTAGECGAWGEWGFGGCKDFTPHFIAIEDEIAPLHPEAPKGLEFYRRGLRVKRVDFSRTMPMVKSVNYVPAYIAMRGQPQIDDVLFTHNDGYVTEGAMCNFFCVIDGKLCTPQRGMLFGITRKVLLELAPGCGVEAVERDIAPGELSKATEAFMTNSTGELMPIRAIDDKVFATTMEGPVFMKLRKAFTGYIGQEK